MAAFSGCLLPVHNGRVGGLLDHLLAVAPHRQLLVSHLAAKLAV